MKGKFLLGMTGIATFVSSCVFAGSMGEMQSRGGWVIGGDLGYGYLSTQEEEILAPVPNSTPPSTEIQNQSHQIGHLIGGGYLGYGFSAYERLLLGLEAGYKYLGQSRYNSLARDTVSNSLLLNNITIQQQAVDLLVTARFYVGQKISFIGKAGAAYVHSQTKDENYFRLFDLSGNLYTNAAIWRIKPEISLGVGYSVSNNIDLNLIYTHIGGVDTNVTGVFRFYSSGPDRTPAVFEYNALSVGASYTFG